MSRKEKIKHLSSEELKSKLYKHFEKSGSLDQLRTQLRGQMVSELFKSIKPTGPDKFPSSSDVDKCLLPIQVTNWLVYEHLSRQDYQYSLSTFLSEAQLPCPEKFLTAGDILKLLGLNHRTTDFERINRLYAEKNELGLLHSILLAIIKTLFLIPDKNLTLNQSSNIDSIENIVDNNHTDSAQGLLRHDFEASGDAKFQGDISASKKETPANKTFLSNDEKSDDVSLQEQLQNVREETEKSIQKLRHRLLMELENLHSKEREMQLEVEHTKSELRREQNKLIKEKEMLKEKEILIEKEATNKAEMKLREVESEFASKLHFKDKEIEALKMRLTEKDEKLTYVEAELASKKESCAITKREFNDLNRTYKIIQEKYSVALDENTNLSRKFESMSDYYIIKEELASKAREVGRLQKELKDNHERSETERQKYVEAVRNLEDDLSVKEPELAHTKKELAEVKRNLNTEERGWKKERKKLEDELTELKELYKIMIEKMEDQKTDMVDLQKTNQILNYKLANNVINAAKSESFGPHINYQRYFDGSQKLFVKRNNPVHELPEKYDDSSSKLLSDAKNITSKLTEEKNSHQNRYSLMFGTMNGNNKQSQSIFKSYSMIPMSKNSTGSYQSSFTKPADLNSTFNLNNVQKSKETFTKTSYSLSDIRSMVSHSLFPHKTGYEARFQRVGNLGTSPQVSNVINSRFSKSWTAAEVQSLYSPTKLSSNELIGNNSTVTTVGQGLSSNNSSVPDKSDESVHFQKEQFGQNSEVELTPVGNTRAVADSDNLTQASENIRSVVSSNLPSQTYSFPDKYEGGHAILNPLEPAHEKVPTLGTDNFTQESERVKSLGSNILPKESLTFPSIYRTSERVLNPLEVVSEKVPVDNLSSNSQARENAKNLKNTSLPDEPKNVSGQSEIVPYQNVAKISEEVQTSQDVTKKLSESSSSGFVNLDAAWKQITVSYSPNKKDAVSNVESGSDKKSDNLGLLTDVSQKLFSSERDSHRNIPQTRSESETRDKLTGITESSEDVRQEKLVQKTHGTSENQPAVSESKVSPENISEAKEKCTESLEDKTENKQQVEAKHASIVDEEKSAEKIGNSDSLSELSELHLSCGSEAEQQKEDSEDW